MMIDRAIEFATKAHEGQFRKGTKRPYIVHPIEVGDIVSTMTKDEEVISAAILHDTIEDCEGVTKELLEASFSERVASLVAQESEDKSRSWIERKGSTIKRIRCAPYEVQMIGLADKLSNMRDIDRDYPVVGEELWNRFRMKDKKMIGWYYKGIRMRFGKRFPRFRLMKSTVTWWTGISEVGNHPGRTRDRSSFPFRNVYSLLFLGMSSF